MSVRNRGPKFTQEEDIILCKAYFFHRLITGVVISHDNYFWENVFSMFVSLTGNPGNRDARRLRARFQSIRLAFHPFLALVIEIDREKFNSVTEDEVIQTALENWEEAHRKPFRYEACFRILKDGPSQAHSYCTRMPLPEFTMEEDVALVRCWLHRMARPMNNDNFWEGVLGHFVTSRNEAIRNSKSLELRIAFISNEDKHYTEVLWMVHRRNSGLSNEELETIAQTKFTEESGKEFRHFECYELSITWQIVGQECIASHWIDLWELTFKSKLIISPSDELG